MNGNIKLNGDTGFLSKLQNFFEDAAFKGVTVEYHDSLASTQIRARELAREGAAKAVVAAGEQTAGRGRAARHWESPKGSGLYVSVLFRPALPSSMVHLVNAAAALSVAGAVRSLLGQELLLKWPNDLLLEDERKVCGILSESATRGGTLDFCVTGIGINLRKPAFLPPEIAERVGWLCGGEETEEKAGEKTAELLARLVKNFFDRVSGMEREGAEPLLAAYREKCASVGRLVEVETDAESLRGLCSGVGNEGELILETPQGPRSFHVADITHAKLLRGQ